MLGVSDDGEVNRYSVAESLCFRLSLAVGDEITDEALSEILASDREYRATKKALSLLSISDTSERALVLKLRRAGYARELSEEVAREMVRLGYVDEGRQLTRLVLSEANESLRGPMKIVPKLAAKGYSPSRVREVLYRLIDEGEVSLADNARRLIEKKLPAGYTAEERRSLLYKYGYKVSTADD